MLEHWQVVTLRELLAGGDADLAAIVVADDLPHAPALDGGAFRANMQPPARALATSIHDFFPSAGAAAPTIGTERDIVLADLGLDFVLYVGFGPCDPKRVSNAKHGLWRFRFGDAAKYANYPPGVREIIAGDPVTAAVLCGQHPDVQDATPLRSGFFATILHRSNANAEQVLAEVSHWPAYVAKNVRLGQHEDDGEAFAMTAVPDPTLPALSMRMHLAWCLLKHTLARLPNLFFEDQWNVGLVDEPIDRFLQPIAAPPVSWFPNRDRNRYFADPMGAHVGGTPAVLCETYDYRTQLGSICALGFDNGRWRPTAVPAIPTEVHASYPFLFKADDDLYCVPETSQAREAVLYKATHLPDGYEAMRVILPNFACIDPTLFKRDNRWWLFCTDAADGEHMKLLVWYADDLLAEFVPHARNPVKIDVRSSRPAGTPFVYDGRLFRPSQDCSRTYGGAVTINEITRLSPTRFKEKAVASVQPFPRSGYGNGLHTLSSFGEMTLIDGKRRIFTGRGLRDKVASLRARVAPREH
jgi:hypothetical protein